MLSWFLLLVGPVLFGHAVVKLVTATPADEPLPWRVVRKDTRIDRLIPKGAALERIAEGFSWGEDSSVLYITADTAVYRIQTGTKGAGF